MDERVPMILLSLACAEANWELGRELYAGMYLMGAATLGLFWVMERRHG